MNDDQETPETNNSILATAEGKIEGQLAPDVKQDYTRIVAAGMHLALDKGPNGILYGLRNSKDPVRDCAVGAVTIVLLMRKHSRGTMPVKAMVPAAMTLMLKALEFADRSGLVKVGNNELDQATHVFANLILKAMKVSPQMLQHAATKVHSIQQNPQQMDMLHRAAGLRAGPIGQAPAPPAPPAPVAQKYPGVINGG